MAGGAFSRNRNSSNKNFFTSTLLKPKSILWTCMSGYRYYLIPIITWNKWDKYFLSGRRSRIAWKNCEERRISESFVEHRWIPLNLWRAIANPAVPGENFHCSVASLQQVWEWKSCRLMPPVPEHLIYWFYWSSCDNVLIICSLGYYPSCLVLYLNCESSPDNGWLILAVLARSGFEGFVKIQNRDTCIVFLCSFISSVVWWTKGDSADPQKIIAGAKVAVKKLWSTWNVADLGSAPAIFGFKGPETILPHRHDVAAEGSLLLNLSWATGPMQRMSKSCGSWGFLQHDLNCLSEH